MVKKDGATVAREAAEKEAKAKELKVKAIRLTIHERVLTESTMYKVQRFLRDEGLWEESDAASASTRRKIEPSPSPKSEQGVVKQETDPSGDESGLGSSTGPQWRTAPMVHRNFKTWGDVPPATIRQCVTACEDIALSHENLKRYLGPGQRELKSKDLLEIREFMTDEGPDEDLPQNRSVASLMERDQKLNIERGRRARNLKLKADWETDGHYKLYEDSNKQLFITALDHTRSVYLDPEFLQGHTASQLTIKLNFSKFRAKIYSKVAPDFKPKFVWNLFQDVPTKFSAQEPQGNADETVHQAPVKRLKVDPKDRELPQVLPRKPTQSKSPVEEEPVASVTSEGKGKRSARGRGRGTVRVKPEMSETKKEDTPAPARLRLRSKASASSLGDGLAKPVGPTTDDDAEEAAEQGNVGIATDLEDEYEDQQEVHKPVKPVKKQAKTERSYKPPKPWDL